MTEACSKRPPISPPARRGWLRPETLNRESFAVGIVADLYLEVFAFTNILHGWQQITRPQGIRLFGDGCQSRDRSRHRTCSGRPKTDAKEDDVGGSLEETAAEITTRGGVAIPVVVDHSDDSQVTELFARIRREQKGRLDLLVNNAYAAVGYLTSHIGMKYWDLESDDSAAEAWDIVNGVGLRNHYICAALATRMMLEYRGELTTNADNSSEGDPDSSGKDSRPRCVNKRPGLIINISSFGGLKYFFNVPYGVGKAAVDRMAADMAHELRAKEKNIAVISLWPGFVKTEKVLQAVEKGDFKSVDLEKWGESPELSGLVIAHLLAEPKEKLLSRSGRVVLVADTALEMGIRDINGKWPVSLRSLPFHLEMSGRTGLSRYVPEFVRLPYTVLNWFGSKF
ncbi:hypothetical protein SprV_0301089000 [Sparganum proliferum]